MPNDGR